MNKIWSALTRHPKKALLGAILALTVLVPVVSNAWGPERKTFTSQQPADYVVFNSITDNPAYGDERNFVRIREHGVGNNTDEIAIEVGKKYTVYIYYHNNAAKNLNLVATNTRVNTQLPVSIKAGQKTSITAKVMADNAKPKEVEDEVWVTPSQDVALKLVSDSVTIHSKGAVNGQKLNPNEFMTNGALIGYDKLDGRVPGCNEFAGYVSYDFIVESNADFKIEKTVSLTGKKPFEENVETKDNETVYFRLVYTNTGKTTQTGVIIKDALPEGLEYVAGSTELANTNTGGKYTKINYDNIVTTGINIGDYLPNGNAYIKFAAKIKDMDCGVNVKIYNYAQAITKEGTKMDNASVTVRTEECVVKDIQVCELSTKKAITVKESDFDSSKHTKDLSECKQVQVCELSTKNIIVIKEDAFDASKHTKDLSKCDTAKDIQVCELNTKKLVTIKENTFDTSKHTKDLSKCISTPPKLPETGGLETLSQVIGLASLVASATYYISSRKLVK